LDTGSSNLWVCAKTCPNCTPHSFFDPTTSKTFAKTSSTPVNLTYGTGSVVGTIDSDSFAFGTLTLPNQQFLLATAEDTFLSNNMNHLWDGILGMGLMGLSQGPGTLTQGTPGPLTPILNMIAQNVVSVPVFSVWIGTSQGATSANALGELAVGGCDTAHFTGSVTCLPVVGMDDTSTLGFWQVPLTGVSLNAPGFKTSLPLGSASTAIMDTGSTIIGLPFTLLNELLSALNAGLDPVQQGVFAINCPTTVSQLAALPNITFTLSGVDFALTPEDYLAQDTSSGLCIIQVNQIPDSQRGIILGDTFLRKYYSIYDGESVSLFYFLPPVPTYRISA
ncbi:aspartic peptidase domain-containing protein, partial [Blyttiomyces helicus]